LGNSVQCRFLLILGCGLGDLVASADPLLLAVVSRGTICVASTHKGLDPLFAKDLVPAFCRAWTDSHARGPTVAAALHQAAVEILSRGCGDRNEQMNSLCIIGTPTLRLEWRHTWRSKR
jgi:hypothetical protein